jgi:hypothetical protein
MTGLTNGTTYTFRVVAANTAGSSAPSAPSNAVTPTALAEERRVSASGHGTVSAPAFSTTSPGDLIVAFVSADGPTTSRTTAVVSGGGLTWTVDVRSNARGGTTEVWHARAAGTLTNVVVKSTTSDGLDQSLTVVAFKGAGGIGARVAASGATGAPTTSLTTVGANSRVYGVGNDVDRATARSVGSGQALVQQWLAGGSNDTFWVQTRGAATGAAGSSVTINDTAPVTDRWNLAAVEIRKA